MATRLPIDWIAEMPDDAYHKLLELIGANDEAVVVNARDRYAGLFGT